MIPVRPSLKELFQAKAYATLTDLKQDIREPVDTITMYVNAKVSTLMEKEILALKPRRVIFNPGAENDVLAKTLRDQGVETVNDCSWILLRAGRF